MHPSPAVSRQRICDYIAAHPGCSVRVLTDELDLTPNTVWQCIRRLRRIGRIRQVFIEGEKRICWEIGEEENLVDQEGNPRDGQPDQRTVSSWDAIDCAQQTWISSLMVSESN